MPKRSTSGVAVFQPSYTKNGKRLESSTWHVRFKVGRTWRRLPGFKDKQVTEQYGNKLRRLADRAIVGDGPGDLSQWVQQLSDDVQISLAEWGVIDRSSLESLRPLTQHIDEWAASLLDNDRTPVYVRMCKQRVADVFRDAKFVRYSDIDRLLVEREIARRIREGIWTRGTSNPASLTLKQFCRWMCSTGRATTNPLEYHKPVRVTDRKTRRALSDVELTKLITTTERMDPDSRENMRPSDRALCYELAARTGLRVNEIRSLRKSSFSFGVGDEPSYVVLPGSATKNRKAVKLPLRADLADRMRKHLMRLTDAEPVFMLPGAAGRLLKSDAIAAGIELETEDGGLTFHSLRYSHVTSLARAGVAPEITQRPARHSTINLTMGRYRTVTTDERVEAVESVPSIRSA